MLGILINYTGLIFTLLCSRNPKSLLSFVAFDLSLLACLIWYQVLSLSENLYNVLSYIC